MHRHIRNIRAASLENQLLEAQGGELGGREETREKIIAALEPAGVIFLDESNDGPGVRLKKAKKKSK
jgi:hypothetical protein